MKIAGAGVSLPTIDPRGGTPSDDPTRRHSVFFDLVAGLESEDPDGMPVLSAAPTVTQSIATGRSLAVVDVDSLLAADTPLAGSEAAGRADVTAPGLADTAVTGSAQTIGTTAVDPGVAATAPPLQSSTRLVPADPDVSASAIRRSPIAAPGIAATISRSPLDLTTLLASVAASTAPASGATDRSTRTVQSTLGAPPAASSAAEIQQTAPVSTEATPNPTPGEPTVTGHDALPPPRDAAMTRVSIAALPNKSAGEPASADVGIQSAAQSVSATQIALLTTEATPIAAPSKPAAADLGTQSAARSGSLMPAAFDSTGAAQNASPAGPAATVPGARGAALSVAAARTPDTVEVKPPSRELAATGPCPLAVVQPTLAAEAGPLTDGATSSPISNRPAPIVNQSTSFNPTKTTRAISQASKPPADPSGNPSDTSHFVVAATFSIPADTSALATTVDTRSTAEAPATPHGSQSPVDISPSAPLPDPLAVVQLMGILSSAAIVEAKTAADTTTSFGHRPIAARIAPTSAAQDPIQATHGGAALSAAQTDAPAVVKIEIGDAAVESHLAPSLRGETSVALAATSRALAATSPPDSARPAAAGQMADAPVTPGATVAGAPKLVAGPTTRASIAAVSAAAPETVSASTPPDFVVPAARDQPIPMTVATPDAVVDEPASAAAARPPSDRSNREVEADADVPAAAVVVAGAPPAVPAAIQKLADAIVAAAGPSSPASAPASPAEVPTTIPAPARTMVLELGAAGLGTVSIRMHVTGKTLDLQLSAPDTATLGVLERGHDALKGALSAQDYQLHSLVIQGGDATAAAPGGNNASHQKQDGDAPSDPRRDGAGSGSNGHAGSEGRNHPDRNARPAPSPSRARGGDPSLFV